MSEEHRKAVSCRVYVIDNALVVEPAPGDKEECYIAISYTRQDGIFVNVLVDDMALCEETIVYVIRCVEATIDTALSTGVLSFQLKEQEINEKRKTQNLN